MTRERHRHIIGVTQAERTERAARRDMAAIVLAFDEALGGVLKRVVDWTLRQPGGPR